MKTNKKTLRRITCLVLVICFSVLALASCGQSVPNAASASGDWGAIHWDYNQETRTLTVTPLTGVTEQAGTVNSVDKDLDNAPWAGDIRLSTQKIVIAPGIHTIGAYAFWGFANATEISLPDSLAVIGDFAFAYCGSVTNVILPKTTLNTIGTGAFEGCASLGSIFIPNTVSNLGESAFAYCYNLKRAVVTGKNIGAFAFKNCRSLEELILVQGLTPENGNIHPDAFLGASRNYESANRDGDASGVSIITIKHVWSDGTPVEFPENIEDVKTKDTLNYGETRAFIPVQKYATNDITVTPLSYTATGNGAPQTITFTYTKNTPAPAPETPAPETTAPETPADTQPAEDEGIKPSTIIAIVIVVLILGGVGVGAFFLMRSDKKNAGKNGTVRKNNKPNKK